MLLSIMIYNISQKLMQLLLLKFDTVLLIPQIRCTPKIIQICSLELEKLALGVFAVFLLRFQHKQEGKNMIFELKNYRHKYGLRK